jgi:hypothetical protein
MLLGGTAALSLAGGPLRAPASPIGRLRLPAGSGTDILMVMAGAPTVWW